VNNQPTNQPTNKRQHEEEEESIKVEMQMEGKGHEDGLEANEAINASGLIHGKGQAPGAPAEDWRPTTNAKVRPAASGRADEEEEEEEEEARRHK